MANRNPFFVSKRFLSGRFKEVEAEIERIVTEKNEVENRLNTLLLQNASVLSQNNQLNQQLQALQTARKRQPFL